MKTKLDNKKIIFIAIACLCVGYFVGDYFETRRVYNLISQIKPLRLESQKNKYISPLIGVESPEATEFGFYKNLKKDIEDIIRTSKKRENVTEVSVYFRDLNTSLWFSVDKEERFYPASLLKLPYAFVGYKVLENDHHNTARKYVYSQEIASINKARSIAAQSELVVGRGYTIEELMVYLIEKSDNGARDLLATVLPFENVEGTFSTIGVNLPRANTEYEMTTEKYARFLRLLYSASYLNEENSNHLLSLLTKTDFNVALTKYLPRELEVAHKWGVASIPTDQQGGLSHQLHDCGIVYHKDSPYVLCIMTKGPSQDVLSETIAQISKRVFEYIEKSE